MIRSLRKRTNAPMIFTLGKKRWERAEARSQGCTKDDLALNGNSRRDLVPRRVGNFVVFNLRCALDYFR